jgi:hypothetical protein
MNILDAIVNARDGAAVQQLGSQVGLGPDQTTAALSALVPALAAGFQRNIQSEGGLESLLSALSSGNHAKYIENPTNLDHPAAVADGNGILGHLLGSKEMGAFSKQSGTASSLMSGLGSGGGIASMLTPLLDKNRDGSMIDDVTSMIGRLMKRP